MRCVLSKGKIYLESTDFNNHWSLGKSRSTNTDILSEVGVFGDRLNFSFEKWVMETSCCWLGDLNVCYQRQLLPCKSPVEMDVKLALEMILHILDYGQRTISPLLELLVVNQLFNFSLGFCSSPNFPPMSLISPLQALLATPFPFFKCLRIRIPTIHTLYVHSISCVLRHLLSSSFSWWFQLILCL